MTMTTTHELAPGRAGVLPVAAGLAVWAGLVAWLALTGRLAAAPGEPPLALFAAVAVPVAAFLALYRAVPGLRAWVLGLDLRLLTMLQAWRVLGGMFLVLLAYGLLPGLFAWPAGLGDVAIGLTAPWVALALVRDPRVAARRGFVAWHVLGILDFVGAVGSGTLASGVIPGLVGAVSASPMNAWPLAMIPGFLVPLFILLHLAALLHAGQARRAARAAA